MTPGAGHWYLSYSRYTLLCRACDRPIAPGERFWCIERAPGDIHIEHTNCEDHAPHLTADIRAEVKHID